MEALYKFFEELLDDELEGFENEKQMLEHILEQGCKSGAITALTWYSQTETVYNDFETAFDDYLDNLVETTGLKPWELFNDWDIYPNSQANRCTVV